MTAQKKQEIKFWANIGLSTGMFIFLVTLSFNVGEIKAQVTNDIKEIRKDINYHASDNVVHMPLAEKIQIFVPRVELEKQLKNMKDQLDRIEDKIDN